MGFLAFCPLGGYIRRGAFGQCWSSGDRHGSSVVIMVGNSGQWTVCSELRHTDIKGMNSSHQPVIDFDKKAYFSVNSGPQNDKDLRAWVQLYSQIPVNVDRGSEGS